MLGSISYKNMYMLQAPHALQPSPIPEPKNSIFRMRYSICSKPVDESASYKFPNECSRFWCEIPFWLLIWYTHFRPNYQMDDFGTDTIWPVIQQDLVIFFGRKGSRADAIKSWPALEIGRWERFPKQSLLQNEFCDRAVSSLCMMGPCYVPKKV